MHTISKHTDVLKYWSAKSIDCSTKDYGKFTEFIVHNALSLSKCFFFNPLLLMASQPNANKEGYDQFLS